MLLRTGKAILIMCILAGQARASTDTSATPIQSDSDVIRAILATPKAKRSKPLAQILNEKFWKMFNFTRPCLDYEEKRLCASASPNKDRAPDVTVIFTWRF